MNKKAQELINKKLITAVLVFLVLFAVIFFLAVKFDALDFFKQLPWFNQTSQDGDVEEIDLSQYHAVAEVKESYIYYLPNGNFYFKSQLYIKDKKLVLDEPYTDDIYRLGQVYGNEIVIFTTYLNYKKDTEQEDIVKNRLLTGRDAEGLGTYIKDRFLPDLNNAIIVEDKIYKKNA